MCKSVKLFHLLLRTEKRSWAFRKWQIDTTFVSVILTCIKRKWTLKVLCKRLKSVIEFLLSCKFLAKMCKNMYELGAVNYWNMCKQKMKIQRTISKDKKRICTILTSLKWIFWTLAAFYSVLSRWSYTASIRLRFRLWIHEWWCSTVWFCCCFFSLSRYAFTALAVCLGSLPC